MWVYLKYWGGPSQEQTCLKSVVSDIRRYLFNLQFISKVLARVGFLFSFFKKSAQEMSTLTRILFSYLHSSDFLLLLLFQKKIINQGSSLASMASMHSTYMRTVSSLLFFISGSFESYLTVLGRIVLPKLPIN